MKWMIASDLHGSAYYTRLLLEAMDREQPDRLLLLGDLLYHGPRNDLPRDYAPKEVIALLNPLAGRVFCVRGNCEAEVDQMVLEFPVLADYCLIPAGKRMLYVTHGHVWTEDRPPRLSPGDILLTGHTHILEPGVGRVFGLQYVKTDALPMAARPSVSKKSFRHAGRISNF